MADQIVRLEQFFAAEREQVFAWFADHGNFGKLFPGRTRRIQASADAQHIDGLGSVREVRVGAVRLEETITVFQPPEAIEYRITRGWPVKNHVGRLRFESVPGGTRLEFSIEFDSKMPFAGSFIAGVMCKSWRRGVRRAVEDISGAA